MGSRASYVPLEPFRSFWRWKSRRRPGRPKVPLEVRQLIREMSLANPLWGAPRIHGELLKLGIRKNACVSEEDKRVGCNRRCVRDCLRRFGGFGTFIGRD